MTLPAIEQTVNRGRGSLRGRQLRRMRMGIMLGALAICAFSNGASAFSDPLSYADETLFGGGGGRWFTGSSADGFGCEVCHEGGAIADLSISGLPLDGFRSGESYEITIAWPASAEHVALIAELTDEARNGVGELVLPRPDATPEPERCNGELLGAPSSNLHEAENGRRLVSVIDCGARRARFRWMVPAVAPEAVWLHVGFITSNEDARPQGDGVTMARRLMLREDVSRDAAVVAQGCAVRAPQRAGGGIGLALTSLCLLAAFAWRRAHHTLEALRCKR